MTVKLNMKNKNRRSYNSIIRLLTGVKRGSILCIHHSFIYIPIYQFIYHPAIFMYPQKLLSYLEMSDKLEKNK